MQSLNSLRNSMRSHNQRSTDLQSVAAQPTTSEFRLMVNSPGETYADFEFSTPFAQAPTITCGYEVMGGQITEGRAPMISAQVVEWMSRPRLPYSALYTGAKLVIVSEAPRGTGFIVHVTATGVAFSGPMD